jgi:hypothetical protein
MTSCGPEIFGSDPANINWQIVRGDTSTIKVEFLDNDEIAYYDTTDWTYVASAYDRKTDIIDELEIEEHNGYVIITAPAEITSFWGSTYGGKVAELQFDLEVTIDNTIWTPVIGSISVLGDVSSGL